MDFVIRPFTDALAPDFHRINAAWIEAMFRLEPTDLDVLLHPRERIVDPGGAVLFLELPGEGVIGAVALQKTGERQFELTKMGVTAAAQGRGAGEALLRAALTEAARLGAERLYLLTSSKCAAAIRMYERNGFRHDDGVMREFGGRYARCDVAMLYHAASGENGGVRHGDAERR